MTLDIEFKLERKPAVIIDIVDSSSQNLSDTLNTEKINEQKIDQSNCRIDECPKLKNGLFAFTQKIILPPVAKRINLEGEVVVEVEVDEFGFVRKTSIIKGIGYGCDEAVESALFSAEFIPGKLDGKEVYSTVILKIPVLQNVQND